MIKCKDAIKVKVIGVTQPIIEDIPDAEGIISYAARVSSPDNQTNFATADKLLGYCAKHGHWSVFETANIVMEIEAPRDISRQILRHNSARFQEFSQRYAEAQQFVIREARLQDKKNRQNSIDVDDQELIAWWEAQQEAVIRIIQNLYEEALSKDIAKECARVILPEGNTMSRLYMNGTVRTWMHYIGVRKGNGTQKEHVWVAEKCREELLKHFPSLEAYV